MRPRVPLGCRLMLTGLSLSQVCSWSESRLSVYTPTFVVLLSRPEARETINWDSLPFFFLDIGGSKSYN